MKSIKEDVIDALESVLPGAHGLVALHEPTFNGNEWDYVKECLDSGWVSSVGQYVDRFEDELAKFTGVKHAVAVVNGTAALHTCLLLSGIEPDQEVLVPAMTFVATANAVSYCQAIPHFIDIDPVTMGVDPVKLRAYLQEIVENNNGLSINRNSGRVIKALLPVHTFGHPVDLDPLLEISEEFNIVLIEDAAESLGSYYKDRHTGGIAPLGALSFNGNKIITSGGGGAILTNDEQLAKKAKHLTTTARVTQGWKFEHDEIGYNYRLPNINAALACAQLEQLPGFLANKRKLAANYHEAFSGVDGVEFFSECSFARSNYWLNTIILAEKHATERDALIELAHSRNIMLRPAWKLLPTLPIYKDCPAMNFSSALDIENRLLNIPSSAALVN